MLSPHARLLHFLSSHFNATRLGSPDIQRIFLRLLDVTMEAVRSSTSHPMARELRFQLILFGLRVLWASTSTISPLAQWRLKEKILSAALSWFKFAPRWSFGSNLLQMKTELRLLTDISVALKKVSFIGSHSVDNYKSMQSKEKLLNILLESEQARLNVWVYPLSEPARAAMASPHHSKTVLEVGLLVSVSMILSNMHAVYSVPSCPDRLAGGPFDCN